MNEKTIIKNDTIILSQAVGAKATNKIKARRNSKQGVWFGLGMMGLVGWSVVVPTLAGAAIGIWLDDRHPGNHSWTITLLIIGLILGCFNSWHWVVKQDRDIQEEQENSDV